VFISVNYFEQQMGVDKTIARFFVDRKPPLNNSFWEGRLLYIGFGNGFVSIPVFYDILFRLGLPVEMLLNERHIQFMEQLMHFAILQERNEIDKTEELVQIRNLLTGRIHNQVYYESLTRYLDQGLLKPLDFFGMDFPALNRADVFLYILCDLTLSEMQWQQAIRYWYALHPSYLIMDDIRDYSSDKENDEENVVVDMGEGPEGFEKAFEMLRKNSSTLREINPVLAGYLMEYEEDLKEFIPVNK
jgi:hypothetical protein